jgi:hypothetical protein
MTVITLAVGTFLRSAVNIPLSTPATPTLPIRRLVELLGDRYNLSRLVKGAGYGSEETCYGRYAGPTLSNSGAEGDGEFVVEGLGELVGGPSLMMLMMAGYRRIRRVRRQRQDNDAIGLDVGEKGDFSVKERKAQA